MRRPDRATPRIHHRVVTEAEIRPKFRFLLSDEAKAEGKQMVRNFGGYTLSRPTDDTRCQFESLVRGIQEGRFPNIAAADELLDGVLIASLQKIADGFRQPETMLWYQSWANCLAQGRPDLMQDAAVQMMTRDERWVPRIVDDETSLLPGTTVNAVYAGGGMGRGRKGWVPPKAREKSEKELAADAAFAARWDRKLLHERAERDIAEIERITGFEFSQPRIDWSTERELNDALRAHWLDCGMEEALKLRWLRLGAYTDKSLHVPFKSSAPRINP